MIDDRCPTKNIATTGGREDARGKAEYCSIYSFCGCHGEFSPSDIVLCLQEVSCPEEVVLLFQGEELLLLIHKKYEQSVTLSCAVRPPESNSVALERYRKTRYRLPAKLRFPAEWRRQRIKRKQFDLRKSFFKAVGHRPSKYPNAFGDVIFSSRCRGGTALSFSFSTVCIRSFAIWIIRARYY